jgi:hypothetical protein
MAADLLLGEKRLIVYYEVKHAFAAGDELKAFDDVMVVAHDVVRHTGGAGPIVSGYAIFERDDMLVHLLFVSPVVRIK